MTGSERDSRLYSLKLLGYRGRSEAELRERLQKKGFSEEVISGTVRQLKDDGYLDDAALALELKRHALEGKLLGYRGAKSFLLKKGLPGEVVESALKYEEDTEVLNAQKLVDKKTASVGNYLSVSEKRRLWNFLLRRGFSSETIRKVLKKIHFSEEDEK